MTVLDRVILTQKLKDEILGALRYAQLIAADSLEITEIFNKPKKEIIKIKQERVNELQRISDELQRCEIISADKVRKIQLATIEHVISHCLGLIEKNRNLQAYDQFDIDTIDPKLLLKEIK